MGQPQKSGLFRKIGQGPNIPAFPLCGTVLVFATVQCAPSSGPENVFFLAGGIRGAIATERLRGIADGSTVLSPPDNEPDNENKIEPHAGIFSFFHPAQ